MFKINQNVEIINADQEVIVIVEQQIVSLNNTAKEILDKVLISKTEDEVIQHMINVYGNNGLKIQKSVSSFIKKLVEMGIIIKK